MRALRQGKRLILTSAFCVMAALPFSNALAYPRKNQPFISQQPLVEANEKDRMNRFHKGLATLVLEYKKVKGRFIEECLRAKDRKNLALILRKAFKKPKKTMEEIEVELFAFRVAASSFNKKDKISIIKGIAMDNAKTLRGLSKSKKGRTFVRKMFSQLSTVSISTRPFLIKLEKWILSKEKESALIRRLTIQPKGK